LVAVSSAVAPSVPASAGGARQAISTRICVLPGRRMAINGLAATELPQTSEAHRDPQTFRRRARVGRRGRGFAARYPCNLPLSRGSAATSRLRQQPKSFLDFRWITFSQRVAGRTVSQPRNPSLPRHDRVSCARKSEASINSTVSGRTIGGMSLRRPAAVPGSAGGPGRVPNRHRVPCRGRRTPPQRLAGQ
jgi:hypothetical protein